MDIETLRTYCLSKKEVEEGFPFGESTLVFKVRGKMFLLAGLDNPTLAFPHPRIPLILMTRNSA